ncbi:hypothetical protein [Streptomyces umbrinus]|uniref:hypothetical protein n=1 Tax=Streptomyces umbrinus TaxID=67370 RepID=UPI0034262CA9
MSDSIVTLIGVGVALPACSIAGGLMLLTRTSGAQRRPPFPCARCDEPNKVYGVLTRCGPCEAKVFETMIAAAERGVKLDDPLTEIRRRMTAKGL